MDFQENRHTEVPAQDQSMNQDTAPAPQQASSEVPADNAQSVENKNGPSYPNGQPYGNNNGTPYQNGQPYQSRPPYGNGTPYPAPQQPYGNHTNTADQNNNPYRNNMPYGNQYSNGNSYPGGNTYQNGSNHPGGNTYQNGSNYPGGNTYQNGSNYPSGYNPNGYRPNNGYNNNYPYYNRNTYQIPVSEPGSNLAGAAMICGILSIISCFTFTVYPAFVLGSVSIILALLSKGQKIGMFSKARTGIICAAIGLVMNTILVVSSVAYVFTNPEQMEKFNEQWEQIYGVPFDEMMDDIMGNDNPVD